MSYVLYMSITWNPWIKILLQCKKKIPNGYSEAVNCKIPNGYSEAVNCKIPNGYSEAVNGRRTDNAITKRQTINL